MNIQNHKCYTNSLDLDFIIKYKRRKNDKYFLKRLIQCNSIPYSQYITQNTLAVHNKIATLWQELYKLAPPAWWINVFTTTSLLMTVEKLGTWTSVAYLIINIKISVSRRTWINFIQKLSVRLSVWYVNVNPQCMDDPIKFNEFARKSLPRAKTAAVIPYRQIPLK